MNVSAGIWVFIPLSLLATAAGADEPPADARPRARQMDQPAERPAGGPARPVGEPAAHLGIVTGPVTEELREHAALPEQGGLLVTRVEQGSPAAKAGLKANDILLAFDGHDVTSPLDLADMVEAAGPGTRVVLDVLRRGKRQEIEVVLGARRERARVGGAPPRRGFAGDPRPPMPGPPPNAGDLLAKALAMAQAEPAGGGGGSSVQVQSSIVNGVAESRAVSRDQEGTVEITSRDGRKTVAIHGPDGGEIHAGPLDEPADFEALPEEWRDKVHALDDRAAGSVVRQVPPGGI